jgi:DNA-binding response OmpR family regulator
MSPIFYLSHSHNDDYSLIRRFFWDLCDTIQVKARSPIRQPVGFLDTNESWNNEAVNALQNCNALVVLLSPSYITSRRAGQEWQTIELRRQRQLPHLQYQRMRLHSLEGVFVPVTWIATHEPVPPPIKDELNYHRFSQSAPADGLYGTLKTRGSFDRTYTRFVNEIATHLLQLSEDTAMPSGDIPPTQVAPAFADGTSGTVKKPTSDPYTVWILENNQAVREMLEEDLELSGYSVMGFETAEEVEREIYSDILVNKMPDLFIVDLVLNANKMQGLDFIAKMTEKSGPVPPIIAVSGHLPASDLVKAIDAGAWGTFSKPLNMLELHKKVAKFTAIGRSKRNFNLGQLDRNRLHRPVFLSYQNEDRRRAVSLRNQIEAIDIGVWYAPDTVEPGNKWRPEVRKGIEEAQVFIALLTDNYTESAACMAELVNFHERLTTESKPPLLVPIIHKLSRDAKNNPTIRQLLRDVHYVDMSREENFLDALTALLGRLYRVISPRD